MPRELSEWEEFISLTNFRLAWNRVKNSSHILVKDRLALNIFAMSTSILLETLIDRINNGIYRPIQAERIYTPKKAGTLRPFPFLNIHDRLVYQAIGNIIIRKSYDELSHYVDRSIFAHIPQKPDSEFTIMSSKSRRDQAGQFEKFRDAVLAAKRNSRNKWNIKTDIAAFYPSIDHDILLDTLQRRNWLADSNLIELFRTCLATWAPHDPELPFKRGVPIGYETSDILATLFLLEVDQEIINYSSMLRYVDDMYIFAPSRPEARRALIQLDQLLQKRSLILQTSKTDIEEYSNSEEDDELRIELELQERLSLINLDMDGTPEDVEYAQDSLYDLFFEICDEYEKHEAKIAFILYRLTIRDNAIRDRALLFLDNMPGRSFHITHYLKQFNNDQTVIEKLLEIVRDIYSYAQVRANCLRTIIVITEDHAEVKSIARHWCSHEEDWYLRLIGVDVLQNYEEEFIFLRQIARRETNEHVRASALAACFYVTDRPRDKIDIIRQTLNDKSYFVKLLGIYLGRREANFDWQTVQAEISLLSEFEFLISAPDEISSDASDFREVLRRVFEFEINPQLPLHEIFQDVALAKQHLLDVYDLQETNGNGFVRAIVELSKQLSSATNNGDHQEVNEIFPDTLFPKVSERVAESMGKLITAAKRLPPSNSKASVLPGSTPQVIKPHELPKLLRDLSVAFAVIFKEVHEVRQLPIPHSLILKTETAKSGNQRNLVFLSHKNVSYDNQVAKNLHDKLTSENIETWLDLFDLPDGNEWDIEIEEQGLEKARVLVLIASPEAVQSKEVRYEVNYAKKWGLHIIPFMIRECAFSYRIDTIQRIDATLDMEQATDRLIEDIKKIL
jgi:retron-type reverse transcriptase